MLQGERLFSGIYVNEILYRLLHNYEEYKSLYRIYQETLIELQGNSNVETILRKFELSLLAELGYAINLNEDCFSHQPIVEGFQYRFTPDIGFEVTAEEEIADKNPAVFRGIDLIALRELSLEEKAAAIAAKRLLRIALGALLGGKPLNSRALFR